MIASLSRADEDCVALYPYMRIDSPHTTAMVRTTHTFVKPRMRVNHEHDLLQLLGRLSAHAPADLPHLVAL